MARRSTAVVDDGALPISDLESDITPRRGPGRPRKSAPAARKATGARPGRKPGTVRIAGPRTTSGQVMSKAQQRENVEAELGLVMTGAVALLEFRIPEAESAFYDPIKLGRMGEVTPLDAIVERTVSLLARKEKWLATAAKGGLILDFAVLATVLGTVGARLYRAATAPREGYEFNGDQYPVYTPPVAPA